MHYINIENPNTSLLLSQLKSYYPRACPRNHDVSREKVVDDQNTVKILKIIINKKIYDVVVALLFITLTS